MEGLIFRILWYLTLIPIFLQQASSLPLTSSAQKLFLNQFFYMTTAVEPSLLATSLQWPL